MNLRLIILLTALTLSACTATPIYRPAQASGFGYTDQLIGDNYYRIEFRLRAHRTAQSADYALARAAELTVTQGYDWFVVVRQETLIDSETTTMPSAFTSREVISRQCGLLSCRTSVHTVPDYGVGMSTTDTSAKTVLEIRMGKGLRPSHDHSYDAHETDARLKYLRK